LTHSGRLTHKVVTRLPWIRRRSGKVRRLQTDILTTEPRRRQQECGIWCLCKKPKQNALGPKYEVCLILSGYTNLTSGKSEVQLCLWIRLANRDLQLLCITNKWMQRVLNSKVKVLKADPPRHFANSICQYEIDYFTDTNYIKSLKDYAICYIFYIEILKIRTSSNAGPDPTAVDFTLATSYILGTFRCPQIVV